MVTRGRRPATIAHHQRGQTASFGEPSGAPFEPAFEQPDTQPRRLESAAPLFLRPRRVPGLNTQSERVDSKQKTSVDVPPCQRAGLVPPFEASAQRLVGAPRAVGAPSPHVA